MTTSPTTPVRAESDVPAQIEAARPPQPGTERDSLAPLTSPVDSMSDVELTVDDLNVLPSRGRYKVLLPLLALTVLGVVVLLVPPSNTQDPAANASPPIAHREARQTQSPPPATSPQQQTAAAVPTSPASPEPASAHLEPNSGQRASRPSKSTQRTLPLAPATRPKKSPAAKPTGAESPFLRPEGSAQARFPDLSASARRKLGGVQTQNAPSRQEETPSARFSH